MGLAPAGSGNITFIVCVVESVKQGRGDSMSMKGTIGYKILTKDPEAIGKMVDALRAKKGMNYQQCFE